MDSKNNLSVKATLKITKYDEHGKLLGVEEQEVYLTPEEAKEICRLQKQD